MQPTRKLPLGTSWRSARRSRCRRRRFSRFLPCRRWVRVELPQAGPDMPRLDEMEIYEAQAVGQDEAAAFTRRRRGPAPAPPNTMLGPLVCLGSQAYRDEAERRYTSVDGLGTVRNGRYQLSVELPPWSARVAYFQAAQPEPAASSPGRDPSTTQPGPIPTSSDGLAALLRNRWSRVRGFNYQPSFGRTGVEIWIDRFDGATVERELALGRKYFPGMNAVRLWLSHDAYFKDPEQFSRNFDAVLAACESNQLVAIPTLFNNWHSVPDFGGISMEMINYWFANFGRGGQASDYVFRPYLEALFQEHATDARILAWDICNEPFNNGREVYVDWLRHTYGMAKTLGAQQPVGVSVAATQNDLQLVEPFSDVLMIHPYFAPQVPWSALQEFAREKGKSLLATECCWVLWTMLGEWPSFRPIWKHSSSRTLVFWPMPCTRVTWPTCIARDTALSVQPNTWRSSTWTAPSVPGTICSTASRWAIKQSSTSMRPVEQTVGKQPLSARPRVPSLGSAFDCRICDPGAAIGLLLC